MKVTKTIKLHMSPQKADAEAFEQLSNAYRDACNAVSQYVFDHDFVLSTVTLHKALYCRLKSEFGLKSQSAQSVFRTVKARYKTVKEQMSRHPFKYEDENGRRQYVRRTPEWLQKPVCFRRPQADLVRNRDYSFVQGNTMLSVTTFGKRAKVPFDILDCFAEYFDGSWKLGTAKLVRLKGEWYLHVSATKEIPDTFQRTSPAHVVGLDRGLRFLVTAYDDSNRTSFVSGKDCMKRRESFNRTRAELQSKGTKSAKRVLKRISGRENRWMSDVNHRISKALCNGYGPGTLFVIEDLTGVSFSEENLKYRKPKERNDVRSWTFYQLEQYLTYKAGASGSMVLKVPAEYTSQRCPKCGRIHKENRKRETHEYICDKCGYRSNDDRVGAMSLYRLGMMYVNGDDSPKLSLRQTG